MNANRPSQQGLVQPHVHYSFLKTASEGLSQEESDSESLAQEMQYQLELQNRIRESEKLAGQSEDDELEEDSLEEKDSLEGKSWSGEGESDVEETQQVPRGSNCGKENCRNASNQEEIVDRYSELRYNPNWKNNKEEVGFTEFDGSHQEGSPTLSHDLARSPSQVKFIYRNHQLQEGPQSIPSLFDRESLNSCDQPASVSNGPYRLYNEKVELAVACHYDNHSSTHSDSFSSPSKEFKQRSEKDFIEKNKLTLGFATQQKSSYLQLHGKKEREDPEGQAHHYKRPEMGGTNSSQAVSLTESCLSRSPVQHPLGAQVELRSRHVGCHNMLEFENAHTNSSTYREVSGVELDSRRALHHSLCPNPSVTPLCPSVANSSGQDSQYSSDPASIVHQNGKPNSMNLTFARNPLPLSSFQSFPGLHSPCAVEKKKYQHNPEKASGSHHQYPYRCTVSEPQSIAGHDKRQNLQGRKSISCVYHAGLQQPVNRDVSSWNPGQIYTEKIPSSYVSGNSGPSQPRAHNLIRAPSPTTWLIQAAERHHREISQLADGHLAGSQFATMFPPIIQRGESDSQLNKESCNDSQPTLGRSNSEGYLLQMEKQKERKEKENRKSSRTKGYMKMDVKLGGLGADYGTIREKSEKMKQQKEYAKHVKEHNMKNISSARKPQPRPEIKSAVSRQKALQYAKTIPKPKVFVSRPLEQEPKDEKDLARTLNGENLPPISSLESLQNRHEKEKQVVAAFKTLHII